MEIVKATEADILSIIDIMKRGIWHNQALYRLNVINDQIMRITPEYIEQVLRTRHLYVGKVDEVTVAVGCIGIDGRPEGRAMINSLFVHPDYHKQGFGKQMLEFLMADEYATSCASVDVASSYSAVEFYKKFGFSEKPDETKHDAIILTKPVG